MAKLKQILWFRRDLRVDDNKLLSIAAKSVLPIFIFDTNILSKLDRSDHRVTFIFQKVLQLKNDLRLIGLDLALFYGVPRDVFEHLKICGFEGVYASFDYDRYARERDLEIAKVMDFNLINDCYLVDHDKLLKDDGTPYKVFTPFYKKISSFFNESNRLKYDYSKKELAPFEFGHILDLSGDTITKKPIEIESIRFANSPLGLQKSKENPSAMLEIFSTKVSNYRENRDFLGIEATSNLSTHLRFGTISVRKITRRLNALKNNGVDTEPFFRQLIWREFFAYILYYFPHSEFQNFQPLKIEWESDEKKLAAWQDGKTGVPIVDAAMRELSQTGEMHNRARMVAASFLVKDLHIDWRVGESYFAKRLFDYDAASNIGSWQWVASTGTDAQPYFRVFNPYLQSKKYDSDATYIKRYVSELKDTKSSLLHNEEKLFCESIVGYPKPIVRHLAEAQKSVEMFRSA